MAEIISFDQWKDAKAKQKIKKENKPIKGFLVWLHCPNCQIYEYTELRIPSGRIHQCGVLVEEVEVAIDICAEWTISIRNVKALEQLEPGKEIEQHTLDHLLNVEKEYQSRLKLIAKREITPYPDDWEFKEPNVMQEILKGHIFLITPARQVELWFPNKMPLQQKDL